MPSGKAAKHVTVPIENNKTPVHIGGEDVAPRDESSSSGGARTCKPNLGAASARVSGENDGGENNRRNKCREELGSDDVHEQDYYSEVHGLAMRLSAITKY